jgi:hypothetical protein
MTPDVKLCIECPLVAYAKGRCRKHYAIHLKAERKKTAAAGGVVVTRSRTTEQDIERGLMAIVMAGGNTAEAARLVGRHRTTLEDWRDKYAVRYMEIRREKGPALEAMVIESLRGTMVEIERVKLKALARLEEKIDADEVKDYSAAMKNLALTQGIAGTKVMELTGRPTAIIEHRSTKELMARLAAIGAIDSTAEEEPANMEASDKPVAEISAATD